MKILMIAPEPFLEPRGTPISVYQRLKGLSRMGNEIDLVTYHVGEDVSIPGVRILRIPKVPFIDHVKAGPSFAKLVLDVLLVAKAFWRLIRTDYDVIHSHEEAAFFSMILAAIFGTAHVYDMHSSLPRQLESFRVGNIWPFVAIFRLLERAVLKTCDAVITIDEDLDNYVRTINPQLKNHRIENLPVPLSAEGSVGFPNLEAVAERARREARLPVIYTGSFERYQGLELMVNSIRELPAEVADQILLVLVGGKPPQIERVQGLVAEAGLQDMVVFVGTVPLDEAVAYLRLGEILVSPRLHGTAVPLKIYSYLDAERAILATDIRAHRMVLDNETAMLVPVTPEGIARGLNRLVKDAGLRAMLASGAKQLAVTNHDPTTYAAKLDGLYAHLGVPHAVHANTQRLTD